MTCSECFVLVELVREVIATCVRDNVRPDERARRLRWATEPYKACCVVLDLDGIETLEIAEAH